MWLTRLFVSRPTLVFVMLAFVTIAGLISYKTLVQQQFPNVELPTVTVSVSYPGASPTSMRDNIVRPIEDQLAGAPDLNVINTTIQQGRATISAVFNLGASKVVSLQEVERRVQAAQSQLPNDLQTPTIQTFDPGEPTVVFLGVTAKSYSEAGLSQLIQNNVIPAVEQVPGVANVNAYGTVTPAFMVTADPVDLEANGYTLNDLVNTISQNNARLPGGIVYQPTRETTLDIRGDIQTPDQLGDLPLSRSGPAASSGSGDTASANVNPWSLAPGVVRVHDVATVTDSYETRRIYSYVNGHPEMYLAVQKATEANEVDTAKGVVAAIPRLEAEFPGVKLTVINLAAKYTEQQINAVFRTLLEGIALTSIVLMFFLGSWRSALVVLISIPTSLLITLTVMKLANFSIDTVSLLAMTIVIGILVDDSIVVLENIERHHKAGEPPLGAAVTGRSEIGLAAIVITMVDVVVFLPIAFLPGVVGKFLVEFGLGVVVATLTSLWVSFTVTPTLAGRWSLHSTWRPWAPIRAFGRGFERVRLWYAQRLLPAGLKYPWVVVTISAVSLVASVALLPLGLVGFEFIPSQDRGEIFVQLTYPTGMPLTHTNATVRNLENFVDANVSDLDVATAVAGAYSSPYGGFVQQGAVGQIHLWLKGTRKHSTDYWVADLRKRLPSLAPRAQVVVIPATGTGGGNAQPLDYLVTTVQGEPTAYAPRVEEALKSTPGAANVTSSAEHLAPQVDVVFDRRAAQALNVSIGTASQAIRAAFGGALATQFESPDGLKDVQVIYPLSDQRSLREVEAIPIRTNSGAIIHVGDVAKLQWHPAPPIITRVNRQTVIHITGNVAPGVAQSNVEKAFSARLAALHLPPFVLVRANPNGNQQNTKDTVLGMGAALFLSVILIYLLMVALYNGYMTPFIIMFSVPVATVGALTALALTRQTLNLFSLIGTIMLVGLVSKNGILLVDYANTLRSRGYERVAAMMESARVRFRPILMTTISMIAGMTPLAMGLVQGSETRKGLGIVVIGGLTSSLLLTLVLVPVIYVWLAPRDYETGSPLDGEERGGHLDIERGGRRVPLPTE
ncbi:MAG TPA: efflux RND transporter permease subunit [Candidatus Dormibacteraeota bacterium]|nr:efflux RND transporter permease subunit [Candidatus Dormibacteraeota bacterium]